MLVGHVKQFKAYLNQCFVDFDGFIVFMSCSETRSQNMMIFVDDRQLL